MTNAQITSADGYLLADKDQQMLPDDFGQSKKSRRKASAALAAAQSAAAEEAAVKAAPATDTSVTKSANGTR